METTIYLAQVERRILPGANRFCFVAQKRPDKTWTIVVPTASRSLPLPHQYHHLAEGVLVLVELNSKREIQSLSPALPEITKLLQDWSMRVLRHNTNEAKIKEWRDSLSLQTLELNRLKQQYLADKQSFELQKASYTAALESMRDRVQTMQKEIDFLRSKE